MRPKRQRLWFIVFAGVLLTASVLLALQALRQNIVFYLTPTEYMQRTDSPGKIRLGGLVEPGSLIRVSERNKQQVTFSVTDGETTLPVRYNGLLPSLFREGQGVVAEGALGADGVFEAKTILAKHDENYMPPEVADKIKRQGQWKKNQ